MITFKLILLFFLLFSVLPFSGLTYTAGVIPTPSTTPQPVLLSGEVSQYQGEPLTPISKYIAYLKAYPDVAIKGIQTIDPSTYKLLLTGLVNNPINYSYNQVVENFNSTQQIATLPCVEGWSVTMLWEGVLITDLLNQAGGARPDAKTVIFFASDGYSSSLPLDYIKEKNIMIAYKMNNITLTPQLGWPFFLVAKDQYGYKWVEWITEIKVSNDSNYLGYWESRGFPNNATVSGDSQGMSQVNISNVLVVEVLVVVCIAVLAVFIYRKSRSKDNNNVQKCTDKP